jgi:hypothetical protein
MVDYRKVNGVYILDAVQPYALCGRTAVASVSEWGSRNKIPEAQIRHIFEDGAKHKGFLLKRLIMDKGFEPIFKKKDEAVPLQAADLLAYETFVGIRSIFEKGVTDFDDLRYPLRMLDEVSHRMVDWGTYSEKDLETFCLNARIPRRDSIDAKDFEGLTRKEIEINYCRFGEFPSGNKNPDSNRQRESPKVLGRLQSRLLSNQRQLCRMVRRRGRNISGGTISVLVQAKFSTHQLLLPHFFYRDNFCFGICDLQY